MEDLFNEFEGLEPGPEETGRRPPPQAKPLPIPDLPALAGDHRPLAERMRPKSFDDFLGQRDLVGPDRPLMKLIRAGRVPSMMLWGPPGSGKTTLARIIAEYVQSDFVTLSAVTSSVRDVRSVIDSAKTNLKCGRQTILFIDEIHRFNKSQQDAFLPHVESGIITLIGATTENPSFSVISPLLSRCRVFVLKSLEEEDLVALLYRGLERVNKDKQPDEVAISAEEDALRTIVRMSDGDGRRALGMLELAASVKRAAAEETPISHSDVEGVAQRTLMYDKQGEEHFNLISALHKTLRSSDPHGAAYWLGRMLAAGEDPRYVARRLIRFASEDIGLADPNALLLANEALRAYEMLGTPEGELALFQAAVYMAMAPKSNSVYTMQSAIMKEITASGTLPVPMHLRNAPTKLMKETGYSKGYTYDHDADDHFVAKQGLPDAIAGKIFYEPGDQGRERDLRERLRELDRRRREAREDG